MRGFYKKQSQYFSNRQVNVRLNYVRRPEKKKFAYVSLDKLIYCSLVVRTFNADLIAITINLNINNYSVNYICSVTSQH